ncbi:hypothetical protein GF357_03410 [Candidatus Dojkabacteria bacterium]|nr:hypothetical protein [Candidatus Dojkabacteria bacterium]
MKTIFFIGRSGSGKSTACKYIYKQYDISFFSLDKYLPRESINPGLTAEVSLEKVQKEIKALESNELRNTVDVGAWFQKEMPIEFWQKRKDHLVLVKRDKEQCFQSFCNRQEDRQPSNEELKTRFEDNEFKSSKRIALYELASWIIENDDSEESFIQKVENLVMKRLFT